MCFVLCEVHILLVPIKHMVSIQDSRNLPDNNNKNTVYILYKSGTCFDYRNGNYYLINKIKNP